MRQTHGEDTTLSHGAPVPTSDSDGTDLVTAFRAAVRCAKLLLTITTGAGTATAEFYARTARNAGVWGVHRVAGLDGATLAAGKTYHFIVENAGGYHRAALVTTGTALAAAYLTEILDASAVSGD